MMRIRNKYYYGKFLPQNGDTQQQPAAAYLKITLKSAGNNQRPGNNH